MAEILTCLRVVVPHSLSYHAFHKFWRYPFACKIEPSESGMQYFPDHSFYSLETKFSSWEKWWGPLGMVPLIINPDQPYIHLLSRGYLLMSQSPCSPTARVPRGFPSIFQLSGHRNSSPIWVDFIENPIVCCILDQPHKIQQIFKQEKTPEVFLS